MIVQARTLKTAQIITQIRSMTRIVGQGLLAVLLTVSLLSAAFVGQANAGEVEVVKTRFELRTGSWHVRTTLRHGDTGWSHYADAWRVVTEKGEDLGTRTLFHPHEQEQPFTRSHTVHIPKGTNIVYVEAHDKVHGWSEKRVKIDLRKASGDRFEVHR
jgi:hypothetical protein